MNLLIVDDETMICDVIKEYCQAEGYSIDMATNGEKLCICWKQRLWYINFRCHDACDGWFYLIKKENIRVEIHDTGPGIKKEDLPHIWDRYYKISNHYHRNVIGTGLGLAIVKQILEAHHYEYGVISTFGKGTTFYFIIPIHPI